MLRAFTILIACLTAAACTAVPKDIKLDAASQQGLVVMEVSSPTGPVRGVPVQFSVNLVRYSPEEKVLKASPVGGWGAVNSAQASPDGRLWIVGRADPGVYVISEINHQALWHACFNAGTRSFAVQPGKVLFLGRADVTKGLLSLASLPSTSMNSQHYFAMDGRLEITPPEALGDWRPAVESYIRTAFPGVTAPVEPAVSEQATFQHRSRPDGPATRVWRLLRQSRKGEVDDDRLGRLANVVDANTAGALADPVKRGGERAAETVVGALGHGIDRLNKPLATNAKQHGEAEVRQAVEAADEREIML